MAFRVARERIGALLEEPSLYKKLSLRELFQGMEEDLHDAGYLMFPSILPGALHLECRSCGRVQPYRTYPEPRISVDAGARSVPDIEAAWHAPPEETPTPKGFVSPFTASDVFEVRMRCTYCRESEYRCWIELNAEQEWIRKVGEVPRIRGSVAPDLKAALGDDIELYRRARACLNDSFGIGACSYLRRLLEDRINPLLRLLLDVKRDEDAPQDELDGIEEALTRTAFKEKAKVLYREMPDSRKLEGDNPIMALYKGLSEGMHGLDEDGCTTLAAKGLGTFEYVARELSTEHKRMEAKRKANVDVKGFRSLLRKLQTDRTDEPTS
jgi:hypothetical protein